MSTTQDFELAALFCGFTIGFGFLTVWEAIKQTRRNRNPLRSQYIYMVWGEIAANLGIFIIGWLFLHGQLGPTIPVLFCILVCWVFQIQLLMQIIVNRIALIAESRRKVNIVKWGTAAVITSINISVFCIWLPAHLPGTDPKYHYINNIWDKIEKILVMIVDMGLNYYFLRTVQNRLLKQNGLKKYAPLVSFNAKLMVLSVAMDAALIGLLFLKNQLVYIQFHPVVYMVKLNIEMSMASLVVKLAQGKQPNEMDPEVLHSSTARSQIRSSTVVQSQNNAVEKQNSVAKKQGSFFKSRGLSKIDSDDNLRGIECVTNIEVVSESIGGQKEEGSSRSSREVAHSMFGDDIPLQKIGMMVNERET